MRDHVSRGLHGSYDAACAAGSCCSARIHRSPPAERHQAGIGGSGLSLALLASTATSSCALVGDACSAPVTGTATYVSGSTPPPYHHEWTVRLEESAGTVTYSPGYGACETWSVPFTPEAGQVGQACRQLRRERDRDTATGGGTLTVRWQGGGGRPTKLTTSDPRAVDLVRTAVPSAAWADAQAGYGRWQQTQRG